MIEVDTASCAPARVCSERNATTNRVERIELFEKGRPRADTSTILDELQSARRREVSICISIYSRILRILVRYQISYIGRENLFRETFLFEKCVVGFSVAIL